MPAPYLRLCLFLLPQLAEASGGVSQDPTYSPPTHPALLFPLASRCCFLREETADAFHPLCKPHEGTASATLLPWKNGTP